MGYSALECYSSTVCDSVRLLLSPSITRLCESIRDGGFVGLSLVLAPVGGTSAPSNIGDAFALLTGGLWALGSAITKHSPEVLVHGIMAVQFLAATFVALCVVAFGQ